MVPRYGLEVRGGAEYACRMFAERLVARGWPVDVFTTCALDAVTWSNSYPSGTADINGVGVHRFASEAGRHPDFDSFASRLLADPARASMADAERFIEWQGPICADAVAAAVASAADLIVFYPYLYAPTVRGVPAAGKRAVMHPAAHDEPALRLPVFPPVFRSPRGLVFQTLGERDLCRRQFGLARRHPSLVLGLGVEPQVVQPGVARAAFGLGDDPYLVSVGRVEDGKGTTLLADLFARYKARHPGSMKLVIAGDVVNAPPPHPDMVVTGPVDDDVKWSLLGDATAFVQPSYYEAFSIALMEAWTAGVPALVNGASVALKEHVDRSRGGLVFTDAPSFAAAVNRVVTNGRARTQLAARGRAYVAANFEWPGLIDRYTEFLSSIV